MLKMDLGSVLCPRSETVLGLDVVPTPTEPAYASPTMESELGSICSAILCTSEA